MFEGKMAMAEILFEPYYTILKKELHNKNDSNINEDLKKEEEKDNTINKNTNIKSNDENKNNNINLINTNINSSNKIILDDNNILLNSFHKNIDEEESKKSIKCENNNIINKNHY